MAPSIAIVGSGPGGLTLARLLYRAKIQYTIFELRSAPSPSSTLVPSGSLDLHPESGQRALHVSGLYDTFLKMTRPGGEDMKIADKAGHIAFCDHGGNPSESRPEIDRAHLTDLLLSSIPADRINWDHKVLSISPSSSNRWTIHFDGRESQTFDLVIGADGAWSRVRKVLTDVKPQYSGVHCITLTIHSISSRPTLAQLVGNGNLFACGDGKALVVQRGSTNSIRIYALLTSPSAKYLSSSNPPIDSLPTTTLKQMLVSDPQYFGDWGNNMKSLILATSETPEHYIQPKPLYMLPIGHTWTSKPGITLLGDAAHLMTPFSGEGVNAAMLDALELAEIIEAETERAYQPDDSDKINGLALEKVTGRYEKNMFMRAKEKMIETYEGLKTIFAADAPKGLVEMMRSHGPPPDMEA